MWDMVVSFPNPLLLGWAVAWDMGVTGHISLLVLQPVCAVGGFDLTLVLVMVCYWQGIMHVGREQ